MKNRISQLFNDYSNDLKRIGVYLLILLFIFGLALNVMINREKIAENAVKNLGQVEISTEPAETKIEGETTIEELPKVVTNNQSTITNSSSVVDEEKSPINMEPKVTQTGENKKEVEEVSLDYSSTSNLNFIWPVEGKILTGYELKYSSTFGDYRLHPGLDLKAEVGTEVKAAAEGKVVSIQETIEKGVVIELEHENGFKTWYAHLEKALVKEGQAVNRGDIIGKIGESGIEEASLGPHLHFEIKQNGESKNPKELLPSS